MKRPKPRRTLRPAGADRDHSHSDRNGEAKGNAPTEPQDSRAKPRESPADRPPHRSGEDFRIIVIGASAGGVEALSRVIKTLPPDLPAAVFVVLHISPTSPSVLPDILTRTGGPPAHHPRDGEKITPGHVYVAPPDQHLLIKPGRVMVTRGPRENNARPAVDPLFRTAARAYGPWVVGVILSGGLDDGTLGLMDVKRFSGVAVVQNPRQAMFPGMPSSAIENVQVDHVADLDDIGPLLTRLAKTPVPAGEGAAFMAHNNGRRRPDIAESGNDDLKTRNMSHPPSRFTCPECGGALWEIENGKLLRYRCHIGHGYTAETLMAKQGERLEDALWSAQRALEETSAMRRRMADRARKAGWELTARTYDDQAAAAQTRAGIIRSVLVQDDPDRITPKSAKAVEAKAQNSTDPDAGRELAHQPPAPQTDSPHSAPRGSAVQSRRRNSAGQPRTSRKIPGANPLSQRRPT